MKQLKNCIVPWVRESDPYSAKHSDFAWQNPHISRMMSNENPLPPSQKVLDAILQAATQGHLYPGSGPELREIIGAKVGLGADNVVLGNGSTDIINTVIGTFVAPGDEVIIAVPTFSMYEARTKIQGGVPVKVPMTQDFYWDLDAIHSAITPKTKLIFICSPNNPTGNIIKEEDLIRILDWGLPVFYDEAYFELLDEPQTHAHLIAKYPLMMVNRTFSKTYGLAGFRLGYLLCEEQMANYLNRVKIPWNVSLVSIAGALAAIDDQETQEQKRDLIIKGRDYIHSELNKIPGIRAFPTQGNFLLVDASSLGLTSKEISDGMLKKNIFIRPMGGLPMLEGYVRITTSTMDQNRTFIHRFKEYIQEISSQELTPQPVH